MWKVKQEFVTIEISNQNLRHLLSIKSNMSKVRAAYGSFMQRIVKDLHTTMLIDPLCYKSI